MNKYFILLLILLILPHNSFAQQQISNFVTPVTYFVDHVKQLNMLKNNLIKYRQASIIGTSGMGKTQLVRMYSYENKNNYKLIWFIDCNLDINEELLKLVKAINSTAKSNLIPEDIKLIRKEVMSHLSNQDKWLLIFDNLKINENKKVQEFVDWEHNGHVIFCSQDSEILSNITKMTVFEKSDAITLANNILENDDPKIVKFLSEEFAGYPILIVQGTQLLNNVQGLDITEYKKKIQQSADKIKLNITLAINQLNPSTKKLLNEIALINNQGFSKELLSFIIDDKNTLDEDLYQLSKFALISNIDPHETNPVFEMHDVIAQKITEINGNSNNKAYLEDIVTKLIGCVTKSVVKAQLFRKTKTMSENLEILARNAEKYNANIYKLMELNLQLMLQYYYSLNYSNLEKKVQWFNKVDQKEKFKLWLMNNDEKYTYADYIYVIGGYYISYFNYKMAKEYFIKAKEIFEHVKGYDLKWSLFFNLAICNITLGQIQEAEENIQIIEKMFDEGFIDKSDISCIYAAKAWSLFVQGKYTESLEQNTKTIEAYIKNGIDPDDPFLMTAYIFKAELLNYLKEYQQAYTQLKQLYSLYKSSQKDTPEILGRIYTEMARSELGWGSLDQALNHINQAISIFLVDERRNPKGADYLEDSNLALSYVVQGDILFAQDSRPLRKLAYAQGFEGDASPRTAAYSNVREDSSLASTYKLPAEVEFPKRSSIKEAIKSYNKAFTIYYYLYRDNRKNVAQVSYLYSQGAKAACKAKNLHSYKFFGKPQVKEFGINHPNTVSMFEYCKQYDMDLWAKEK